MILGPSIHYASAEGIDKSDVSTSSLFAALAAGKKAQIPDTSFTAWADVSASVILEARVADQLNRSATSPSDCTP